MSALTFRVHGRHGGDASMHGASARYHHTMMRRLLGVGMVIVWCVCSVPPADASVAHSADAATLQGAVVEFVTDRADGRTPSSYYLVEQSGLQRLAFTSDAKPATHTRVQVTGRRTGDLFVVDRWSVLSDGQETTGGVSSEPNPNLGEQHMLVLLVNFADLTDEPIAAPAMSDVVFNTPDVNSWDAWVRDASYDRAFLTGDVYGWFTLPDNATDVCDPETLLTAVFTAVDAAQPSIDFTAYSRMAILTPQTSCDWKGAGTVGIATLPTPDGDTDLSVMELNGLTAALDGAAPHEFGHNLGLRHSGAWECGASSITGPCTSLYPNYDNLDPLGSDSLKGHYNAPHKEKAGWFEPGELVETTGPGVFELTPISMPGGLKALKIPIAGGLHYYVEYRQPVGYDRGVLDFFEDSFGLGAATMQGALIHTDFLFSTTKLITGTQLIDLSPGGSADSQVDAAQSVLRLGSTFEDPANDVYLKVISAGPDSLTVCLGEGACDGLQVVPAASTWGLLLFALVAATVGTLLVGRTSARE